MKTRVTILFSLALALLAACGGAPAASVQPTTPPAADPPASTIDLDAGKMLFVATCAACHGPEGKGIENLGKDFTTSEYVNQASDSELLEFIKVGRAADDPLNSTGIIMPAKGGNASLSDDDLLAIIAYMRSIQQ